MSKSKLPPPRMARARMQVATDILLMLSELPTLEDALAVIAAVDHLKTFHHIEALFRPCELPATTRRDLLAEMIVGRFAKHRAYDNTVQITAIDGDRARVEHSPNAHAWVLLEDLELD